MLESLAEHYFSKKSRRSSLKKNNHPVELDCQLSDDAGDCPEPGRAALALESDPGVIAGFSNLPYRRLRVFQTLRAIFNQGRQQLSSQRQLG